MANVYAATHAEPDWGVDDQPHVMVKHMQYTFATTADATVVYAGHVPAGAYIMGIQLKSADLGTGTVDVGYINDTTTAATAFATTLDVGTAAVATSSLNFAPIKLNRRSDIIVTAHATGTFTGQLDLVVTYRDDGIGTRLYT